MFQVDLGKLEINVTCSGQPAVSYMLSSWVEWLSMLILQTFQVSSANSLARSDERSHTQCVSVWQYRSPVWKASAPLDDIAPSSFTILPPNRFISFANHPSLFLPSNFLPLHRIRRVYSTEAQILSRSTLGPAVDQSDAQVCTDPMLNLVRLVSRADMG